MLNEIIRWYNSLKIKMVNKLGDGEEGILDELDFLDDTLIESKIKYIKKLLKLLDYEISNNSVNLNVLIEKKEDLIFELVFLASNSIKNIDFCLSLLSESNKFKKCLYALKEYDRGNFKKSIKLFVEYFENEKHILEHYLICKTYGELLYNTNNFYNSAIFFRKAVEKRPDEIRLHLILKDIYLKIQEEILLKQEEEIIKLLGV